MMYARLVVFLALAIFGEVTAAASRPLVSFDGVGPVSIGMSVKAIERALGARLNPADTGVFSEDCYITDRSDKVDPGIQYTIHGGRLTRIDVWMPDGVTTPSDAATREGIGINSLEADVKRIYGKQLAIKLAPDFSEEGEAEAAEERKRQGLPPDGSPPQYYLQITRPKDGHGIIFNTEGGKVIALLVGLRDDINANEMCR